MRAVTARGRLVWGLSGLATAAVLSLPGARLLSHPGLGVHHAAPGAALTRTVSVSQPISSLDVQSQGGQVRVQAGSGHGVRVTELISYDKAVGPPVVQDSVSGGRLTLADPECATSDCSVSFSVTVPSTVSASVTSMGGPVAVSGVASGFVESGGGPVTLASLTGALTADTGGGPLSATGISGQATISTDGGLLAVTGLTGPLQADSGGGPAILSGIRAQTATITTGGGSAQVVFHAVPQLVDLSTDGGPASLNVPGGPYALNADSDGGPESVHIATDPSASRSLTVTSGGGFLTIGTAGAGQ